MDIHSNHLLDIDGDSGQDMPAGQSNVEGNVLTAKTLLLRGAPQH